MKRLVYKVLMLHYKSGKSGKYVDIGNYFVFDEAYNKAMSLKWGVGYKKHSSIEEAKRALIDSNSQIEVLMNTYDYDYEEIIFIHKFVEKLAN